MGSNKASLLLVMTIFMLHKCVKLDVIGMCMQLCGVTLMTSIRKRYFPLRILPNVFFVCREEKPRFEMRNENK